jgi:hypothetical protein
MTILDQAIKDLETIEQRIRDNMDDEQRLIAEIQEATKKIRKMGADLKYAVAEAEFPA